ncbi:MAG: nucleoside deaminase [Clostridia bacterium]|nr:nucleoside deaminase [Clostridia bacterium]
MVDSEKFMREALKRAKKAAALGEMPVGAVIVRGGHIVASGYNRRETKRNALLHAELIAIDRACKKLGGWRLPGCEMYVTLEPCPMCAGAILNSRMERVYYGAADDKSGCAGSRLNLLDMKLCNYSVACEGGILGDECRELIKNFFKKLRKGDI